MQRGVELASRGQQLQRVQPHEPFGSERCRDLGVERAQVEWLAAQPGDHVTLGEAVLSFVVERDRDDRAGLGRQLRQHVRLQPPGEASRPQVPVQALVRILAAEPLPELRARPEVAEAPEDPQLGDELRRPVHHRRPGQSQHEAFARDGGAQPLGGLRALGPRVLAVVRLVERDGTRSQRAQGVEPAGDDVVVDDGQIRGRDGSAVAVEHLRRARRQPALDLPHPVELQAGRAHDDRRVRTVRLDRRQRFHGLAEALLVGEKRTALLEQVLDPGALERLQLAAECAGPNPGRRRSRRTAPPARRRERAPPGSVAGGPAPRAPPTARARRGTDRDPAPRTDRQRSPAAGRARRPVRSRPDAGRSTALTTARTPRPSRGRARVRARTWAGRGSRTARAPPAGPAARPRARRRTASRHG